MTPYQVVLEAKGFLFAVLEILADVEEGLIV
jgi:hypothetical protein